MPSNSAKPSEEFIEKVKTEMQKRYDASKNLVDSKRKDWERWDDMYKAQQTPKQYQWESNLVIPKANYIINTVHPQIMTTLFQMAQWVTFKNTGMKDTRVREVEKWFVWFAEKLVGLYLVLCELFKASPKYGTSFCKLMFKDGVPQVEYVPIDDFYPDATHNKPGDIDGMKWAFHKFEREFSDLEKAVVSRVKIEKVPVPKFTSDGEPVRDFQGEIMYEEDEDGKQKMESIPVPVEEPLYFDLDKVWSRHKKAISDAKIPGTEITSDIPKLKILEGWGEIDTRDAGFNPDTGKYKPGAYEEYIVTAVLEGDMISEIIRCEKSTLSYYDAYKEKDIYLKPFVPSIYTLNEGEFYGMGAIEPVESIIAEQEEHHNMALDNHKRAIMTILSVLERSGLQRSDLALSPFNIWYLKNHADVMPVKFPDVDMGAFNAINSILDMELDRTTGATQLMQGVPVSKRITAKEHQSSITEATKRFSVFIQLADRLTMRPLVFKLLLMASKMKNIIEEIPFQTPGGDITVTPDELMGLQDITFAATGAEDEFSKYAKQDRIPKLLQGLGKVMEATSGEYKFDMPSMLEELENTYDWRGARDIVKVNPQVIPVDKLKEHTPDQMKQAVGEIVKMVQKMMEQERKGE